MSWLVIYIDNKPEIGYRVMLFSSLKVRIVDLLGLFPDQPNRSDPARPRGTT